MEISLLFNPGLYQIICLKNNKIYIGESSNVLSRLGRHTDALENNRHDCEALQTDFNLYGRRFFKFESLKFTFQDKNLHIRKAKELKLIKEIPKFQRYNTLDTKQTFFAKSVMIKGELYPSLSQAALVLKESRTNLVRKCKNDHNCEYNFFEQSGNGNQKYAFRKATPCLINNIYYPSLSKAGKKLKINHKTIKHRIESNKWEKYTYVKKDTIGLTTSIK